MEKPHKEGIGETLEITNVK